MKKVLTLLAIMAIAMGMVFAVAGNGSVSGSSSEGTADFSGQSATLEIALTLDGSTGSYFEIGFANKEISKLDDVTSDAVIKTLTLDQLSNGGDYSNADGTAYVYWVVKNLNDEDVKIQLKAGDAMAENGDGGTSIAWKATATTDSTSVSTDSTNKTAADVASVNAKDASSVVVDSATLTVSTVDLLNTTVSEASYSGTLTLTITT